MRILPLLIALAGCDKLFSLTPVPDAAPDAPPDAAIDAPDAMPDSSISPVGCADGAREAFVDLSAEPNIAGCDGAWTVPGLRPIPAPMCDRRAGNTGATSLGTGCSATDLCAEGWHVCTDRLDVYAHSSTQSCAGIAAADNTFYATGQSGDNGNCSTSGVDDVFGCGTIGVPPLMPSTCTPLDKGSNNECSSIDAFGGWACTYPNEIENVTKSDPTSGGGVMCCRDEI